MNFQDFYKKNGYGLTFKHFQVIYWLNVGKNHSEICEEMKIKPSTLSTHLKNIKEELDVKTEGGILNKATELGILPMKEDDNEDADKK